MSVPDTWLAGKGLKPIPIGVNLLIESSRMYLETVLMRTGLEPISLRSDLEASFIRVHLALETVLNLSLQWLTRLWDEPVYSEFIYKVSSFGLMWCWCRPGA